MNQPSMSSGFRSVFDQVWDVVVLGTGYSGYAAARRLHGAGKRVLLVGREAALLWESGWGFSTAVGTCAASEWGEVTGWMRNCEVAGESSFVDGALAELCATLQVQRSGMCVLYYAAPLAAWRDGNGQLGALAIATKAGIRTLAARAWVDATETGELLALLDVGWHAPVAAAEEINLYFRSAAYADSQSFDVVSPELPKASLRWQPTQWANERVLTVSLPGETQWHRDAWLPVLRAVSPQREKYSAVVTHASVVPVASYAAVAPRLGSLPANVTVAVPGAAARVVRTLADRFAVGLEASEKLQACPVASGITPPLAFGHDLIPGCSERAAVVVAGVGTGGALAAIAAGRGGADTFAFDPLPFAGGIGTGGGIHIYYYGVKGGLQEEVDQRVHDIMPLFGKTSQVGGFHPDAKKLVLDQMMREAGVRVQYDASIYAAGRADGRITHADLCMPTGPKRLCADAWIDCTGDADLAAFGGAEFIFGRQGDGQLHAYSQSSGRAGIKQVEDISVANMYCVNYDAGFVDPTDSEDLTRARLVGIVQYEQATYTQRERPTYIAPAIGLRQARQIVSDYMVTLADMLERRRFDDTVGMTGCHYDNHSIDYEFESDEGMFWVWCCRQWRAGRTASELPYRMMLPKGLSNVLVACRAAGISEEAHHSLRMQRDFQRLGEAAGYAAALMVKGEGAAADTRQVSYPVLRQQLEATGALRAAGASDPFGAACEIPYPAAQPADQQLAGWVEQVRAGFSPAMYHLMRRPDAARGCIMPMLGEEDPLLSWRSATIAAMWSEAAAEPRLLRAIVSREYGFDASPANERPETNNRLAPHWLVAVALLRRCGTPACVEMLCTLAADTSLLHNARTALALTLASLAKRLQLSAGQTARVAASLKALVATPAPNAAGNPQRKVVGGPAPSEPKPDQRHPVVEDFNWQLHLAVAKAEQAAGVPVHQASWDYLGDPRAMVRRAFARVLQPF